MKKKTRFISLIKTNFLLTHVVKGTFLIGRLKFPCSNENNFRAAPRQSYKCTIFACYRYFVFLLLIYMLTNINVFSFTKNVKQF